MRAKWKADLDATPADLLRPFLHLSPPSLIDGRGGKSFPVRIIGALLYVGNRI